MRTNERPALTRQRSSSKITRSNKDHQTRSRQEDSKSQQHQRPRSLSDSDVSGWSLDFLSDDDDVDRSMEKITQQRPRSLSDSDASGWSLDFIVDDDDEMRKKGDEIPIRKRRQRC